MSLTLANEFKVVRLTENEFSLVAKLEENSHSHPWSHANIMSALSSQRVHVLGVLDADGGLAAYAVFDCIVDELTLQNIAVAKHQRRKGLAKYLISYSWTLFPHASNQFLEVRASNLAAIALYQFLGFCEVGLRANYYPSKSGREDAIIMAQVRPE